MPVILNVRIDMILQRMDKTESFLSKLNILICVK